MQSKIRQFLERCYRRRQCDFEEKLRRYVFELDEHRGRGGYSAVLYVYPDEGTAHFLETDHYDYGPDDPFLGDSLKVVLTDEVYKTNLAEAILRIIREYDVERRVSKKSLRILR